jgi:carboxypeptidase C (cathepsin A)
MKTPLLPLFALMLLVMPPSVLAADDPPKEKKSEEDGKPKEEQPPVIREATVEIAGKTIPYKVTTAKLQLKQEDGKARASIFHVSYERTDVKDVGTRPVMFNFNGGPGSSAVWLHLGVLGPKIIDLPGDGTQPPVPPVRIRDNPLSILDVCDLVFVDPVSTGYSRAENDAKPGEFHGLNEDIESVGDFIRRWITDNKRWSSPKFLLGESYGGVRVAGLSHHLQSRYGMSLNGVVLLSSLLDFATLQETPGNDLAHLVFLPSFTGTAHFHRKIQGDRDQMVDQAREFAFGAYASALLKGSALPAAERDAVAAKLESLSGIAAETWIKHKLRLGPSFFRSELLRDQRKVLGRFDARVAWDEADEARQLPGFDPSYSLALGAFSTAMMDYLGRDLGFHDHRPYEILTGRVQPWRWNNGNEIVNLSNRLGTAMRDNPHLRVLIMGGHTDLATPPEGVAYSIRHLHDLPENAATNIRMTFYDGGHMFYLNPPDLVKTRKDLVDFISWSVP